LFQNTPLGTLKKQKGLKLNGRHQLLVYPDDVTVLDQTTNTTKNITEYLLNASKKICLEGHAERTNYTLISPQVPAGQNHKITTVNKSFENVAKFRCLRLTLSNGFMKNFRADQIRIILATIQFRTFCLLVCSLKT
jgi:hypothetical protein